MVSETLRWSHPVPGEGGSLPTSWPIPSPATAHRAGPAVGRWGSVTGPVAECLRAAPVPLQGGAGLDLPRSRGSRARRSAQAECQRSFTGGSERQAGLRGPEALGKLGRKGPGVSLSAWVVSSVLGTFDRHQ